MPNRPVLYQTYTTRSLTVLTTPTPIGQNNSITELINSIVISVPASAANNVFFGDSNVTTTSGVELVRGAGPIEFVIEDERMLYELMQPTIKMAEIMGCDKLIPADVPFVAWDLSQIFLIAAANTTVSIATFRAPFI
jgi:hypothetical protein